MRNAKRPQKSRSNSTLKELQNRGLHPLLIEAERQKREKRRLESVAHRASMYQQRKLWGDLLRPLHDEMDATRTQLATHRLRDTPERRAALEGYLLVMTTLDRKLTHAYKVGPRQTMKKEEIMASSSAPLPTPAPAPRTPLTLAQAEPFRPYVSTALTRGAHWVDWVPPHIARHVYALFERVPHQQHVRRKAPFERRVPSEQHKRNMAELRMKTQTALDRAQRTLQALDQRDDASEARQAAQYQVRQIRKALRLMDDMHKTSFVPATWHGVLQMYEQR